RVLKIQLALSAAEEFGVLGDGAGPATLDEADAQAVQLRGDRELVRDRQVQSLLLRAIAQRGVVDVEAVVNHREVPFLESCPGPQSKRPLAACERSARPGGGPGGRPPG